MAKRNDDFLLLDFAKKLEKIINFKNYIWEKNSD